MTADLIHSGDTGTTERLLDEQQSALQVSTKPDDVPIANRRDEDLDEADPDTLFAKQYSATDLAVAASFGGAVPGAVSMLHATLFRTLELHGEYSLSNGGGPIGELTREELAEKRAEEDADEFSDMLDEMERRDDERRREEWARASHSFAGLDMTGKEWGEFADDLSIGGRFRSALLARIKQDGNKTDAEAEKEADEVALLARMRELPPEQWTEEMKKLDQRMQADPKLDGELKGVLHDVGLQRSKELGAANDQERVTTTANQVRSVTSRADIFDTGDANPQVEPASPTVSISVSRANADFPSAPDLQEHHKAALAAAQPLDAAKPPMQVAAVAPQPTPGGGFNV